MNIMISQETVNMLQRYELEYFAYKDVITTMFDIHKNDADASAINSPIFNSYHDKYMEAKLKYDLLKTEISDSYIPDVLKGHEIDWTLDYSTNVLTLTAKCDCGKKIMEAMEC